EVRQRTDGDDLKRALLFQRVLMDGIPGTHALNFGSVVGEVKASHAVGAMHLGSFHALAENRSRCPAIDRYVPVQKLKQSQGVIGRVLQPNITSNTGDCQYVQLRQLLCQQKGDGVIHAWVTVQDHRNGAHSDSFPYQEAASARRSINPSRSMSTRACVLGG